MSGLTVDEAGEEVDRKTERLAELAGLRGGVVRFGNVGDPPVLLVQNASNLRVAGYTPETALKAPIRFERAEFRG